MVFFFALRLTFVLHTGLQSAILFIFHMFCVRMGLFLLLYESICLES